MTPRTFAIRAAILLLTAASPALHAQATRTWVSGVGDDANPCSRTAPCKTFAGAISKTAAGGEINVLDPGGFGAVTITKAISIESKGELAGVLVSGTNGIVISAAATDKIVLRGLFVEGLGTGLNGIRFLSGESLQVEDCTINNFAQKGIDFEPSGTSTLLVRNTTIRNGITPTTGGAILVKPTATGSATASLENVTMDHNLFGLRVEDNAKATVRNSSASSNKNNGFLAYSASAPAEINVDDSTSANNGIGVKSEGAAATVRISNVTITDNGTGLTSASSGAILSYGNNRIAGNPTPGAPTGSALLQ
jgi:hypothetical protein